MHRSRKRVHAVAAASYLLCCCRLTRGLGCSPSVDPCRGCQARRGRGGDRHSSRRGGDVHVHGLIGSCQGGAVLGAGRSRHTTRRHGLQAFMTLSLSVQNAAVVTFPDGQQVSSYCHGCKHSQPQGSLVCAGRHFAWVFSGFLPCNVCLHNCCYDRSPGITEVSPHTGIQLG